MNVLITLVEEVCANCQIHFAIDQDLHRRCRDTGREFFCPNGHSLLFKDTELDKAKQRIRSLEQVTRWTEQNLESERRSHAATKGKLTKTKNRIANGVCPCCNRSFSNLHQHIETKHPDYKKQTA